MNDSTNIAALAPTVPGTPFAGGFYAGRIMIADQAYALIVSPKADGDHDDIRWNNSSKAVDGALSYFDGLANTRAMAEAGSKLAQWALSARIGEYDDWYLPAQDELEILYRNLKPTTEKNWLYARSGINLSAVPPTRPYTADMPSQSVVEAFQAGGEQAFATAWYWSSTQHAGSSSGAWFQYFVNGGQGCTSKSAELRARLVRRLAI